MNDTEIKRFMKAKRRKGLKQYPFGFQLRLPQTDPGQTEAEVITFQGSFDRRKLRKMVRKSLGVKMTVEQIDWLLDNFGTPLRQVTMDELIAEADAEG